MGRRIAGKVLCGILVMLLSACLILPCVSETLAGYYSSRTLEFTLSPDLSQVPTPMPTIEPSPTETPTPTPTGDLGTGLVFDSSCSINKVEWNQKYHGDVTSISMNVDNANHKMHFDVVFTVPDGYTEKDLKNNPNWFSGFYVTLSAINRYDGKASLAGIGSDGNGSGVSQLKNINLKTGASSDKIKLYFYNNNWQIPEYDVAGNTVTVETQESYTNIGINIDRAPWYVTERYYHSATITLVLPSQAAAQAVGDAMTDDAATATPAVGQTAAPTLNPTVTPTPDPTSSPEAETLAATLTAAPTTEPEEPKAMPTEEP